MSWQAARNTTVEFAYSGNMGIHLFMGQEDLNPKDSNNLSAQLAQNVNTTGTINDPLGRVNPITGKVLAIQNGTLGSPYLWLLPVSISGTTRLATASAMPDVISVRCIAWHVV